MKFQLDISGKIKVRILQFFIHICGLDHVAVTYRHGDSLGPSSTGSSSPATWTSAQTLNKSLQNYNCNLHVQSLNLKMELHDVLFNFKKVIM